MTDAFEYVYEFTRKAEGGRSRWKNDPGGPTQLGIDEHTFEKAKKQGLISRSLKSVYDISPEDAKRIFRDVFWKEIRGDELPLDVAVALFDTAVNSGSPKSVEMLQKILKVKPDGIVGPGTLEAIKNYKGDLIGDYLDARLQAYEKTAKGDPKVRPALENWHNRVKDLRSYVAGVLPYYLYYGGPERDPKKHPTPTEVKRSPAPTGTPQNPIRTAPVKNHSSLGLPDGRNLLAPADAGIPAAFRPVVTRNLLSPETPQSNLPPLPVQTAHYPAGPAFPGANATATPAGFAFPSSNTPAYGGSLLSLFSPLARNYLEPQPMPSQRYGITPSPSSPSPGQTTPTGTAPVKYSVKDKLDFLKQVYALAKPASEETGLSLPFILAHAAHESGWGKNLKGNNLFNLEADGGWKGPTVTDGGRKYRAYPSFDESMKDYFGYLQDNPRYGKMFGPVIRDSVKRLADAVQYAGFRDDPLYARRITAAAQDPLMKRALWQFGTWLPG